MQIIDVAAGILHQYIREQLTSRAPIPQPDPG